MSETTAQTTNPLDAKILGHLGDRVILKPLTRWNEAYKEFPRYVMEYLVSRYVEPGNPVAGQHKIDKISHRALRRECEEGIDQELH
jgi:predicted ATP-dependent Lon-type protease